MSIHLSTFDTWLTRHPEQSELKGFKRFLKEFWFFGLKCARACLFAGLFFLSVMLVPRSGLFGLPRYDALLLIAVAIQTWMVWTQLETWDELKAITVFHLVGFALEAFKVSGNIQSWSYPDFAYSKVFGVPLFSGFMYAAVGSYIIQAWRLFDMRIRHHPSYGLATLAALMIYVNFFTHHYIGDYRWYIGAFVLGLYARTRVIFRPLDRDRWMPLLLGFVLTGFFIWLAENIGTFFGVWRYPNQIGAWATVHIGKWSSWAMLVVMTFTIIVNLKHVKETIHVPEP
ncbi:hypothetical protein DTO96_101901 [Ephemeroptericola cinctiostellae]|uniref:DUF817 domain-containing protein n=1 Tax=Ephemeroptericola cinctiostellae TaxID=2268024 RepID=A0A345DCS2_9BURK|nr:DUF817 domain-containing protein [Ephemeroptericola cinctiostellae]AXF86160.1 hypothetical protein DTO96_101901 [Ephemeroptericola cinctiostellae]